MKSIALPTTLCARQPIFDRGLDVYAYELLYRGAAGGDIADFENADAATSQVILSAFTEIPFEDLLSNKKGFINFTRELLKEPPPVDAQGIVIELLENIKIDEELLADLRTLKKMGYSIALDDYVHQAGDHELLKIADFIKIEIMTRSYSAIKKDIDIFKHYDAILLAEKIETHKDFNKCQELGFKLFQGHFLSKPTPISGKRLGQDQQAVIRLINVLQNRSSEFSDIEKVISSSASLTYKLLRLLNSSAFSIPNHIDSVAQALTILGLERLKSWGVMLALSNIPSKPSVMSSNALIRAKMCELLGEALALSDYEDALFTLGLLSTLDVFLDVSIQVIVESLDLSEWMKKALLKHEGSMGLILHTAICYERADFESVDLEKLKRYKVQDCEIQSIYERSIVWTATIMDDLT